MYVKLTILRVDNSYPLMNIDKKYKNKKFLEAIDLLQEADEKEGDGKLTDPFLSKLIYESDPYIIRRIRDGKRSTPDIAIINLCFKFNLDFNFFYREGAPLYYGECNPQHSFYQRHLKQSIELEKISEELFSLANRCKQQKQT